MMAWIFCSMHIDLYLIELKSQNLVLRTEPSQNVDIHRKTRSSILPTKNIMAIIRLIINELSQFYEKTFRPPLHIVTGRVTFAASLRKGSFVKGFFGPFKRYKFFNKNGYTELSDGLRQQRKSGAQVVHHRR